MLCGCCLNAEHVSDLQLSCGDVHSQTMVGMNNKYHACALVPGLAFKLRPASMAMYQWMLICLAACFAGRPVQLLKGLDNKKDQSYFLASVPAQALQHFIFPLGSMLKADVRAMASEAGLTSASRRSSAGVCFIGGSPAYFLLNARTDTAFIWLHLFAVKSTAQPRGYLRELSSIR